MDDVNPTFSCVLGVGVILLKVKGCEMSDLLKIRTDKRGLKFCTKIASIMMQEFGISKEEAFARVNWNWAHSGGIVGRDIAYHESEQYWAYNMYYGKDSTWWVSTEGLKPAPVPEEFRLT